MVAWTDPDAPTLVLASASPRRRELLARLGLHPLARPAHIDETAGHAESPDALVLRLAREKCAAGAERPVKDEVVLAADTIVTLEGRVFGKPRDRDDAADMLTRLSGRTHEVMTGIAVRRGPDEWTDLVVTAVTFRSLSDAEVAWYLDTGEPTDKAGAYGLQGAGAVLVERIVGSDTNVIGLPLAETVALLRRAGVDVLSTPR